MSESLREDGQASAKESLEAVEVSDLGVPSKGEGEVEVEGEDKVEVEVVEMAAELTDDEEKIRSTLEPKLSKVQTLKVVTEDEDSDQEAPEESPIKKFPPMSLSLDDDEGRLFVKDLTQEEDERREGSNWQNKNEKKHVYSAKELFGDDEDDELSDDDDAWGDYRQYSENSDDNDDDGGDSNIGDCYEDNGEYLSEEEDDGSICDEDCDLLKTDSCSCFIPERNEYYYVKDQDSRVEEEDCCHICYDDEGTYIPTQYEKEGFYPYDSTESCDGDGSEHEFCQKSELYKSAKKYEESFSKKRPVSDLLDEDDEDDESITISFPVLPPMKKQRLNETPGTIKSKLVSGAVGALVGAAVTFFGLAFAGSE